MRVSNRDRVKLHEAWWRRENTRPLVDNFAPVAMPHGGLDIEVSVERIGERKIGNARALETVAQDLLVVQRVDFGPAILPALAGAGFHHDPHTSWNTPVAERCSDLKDLRFDRNHPLWIAYAERRDEMLRHWSWDTFLPGHLNNVGPFDILAGLMGSEALMMQMFDDPAGVAEVAGAAAELLADVMREEATALRKLGPAEGTTDGFRVWLPGNGTRFVEDFTALIGPEQTRECILPASRRATEGFDSILYHTHSAAWKNLPIMAEVGGRVAIEFGTDPGQPDLDTRIATVRGLQERGLPVQYGSWNHPLGPAERQRVLDALDPRGLIVRFQVSSVTESESIYREVAG